MASLRYARQELLPEFAGTENLLFAARVGIAGCGGLGGLCAYLLAAAGVGELRLADGDVVSLSNLHRQVMYDLSALGRNKAVCLKERIAALNPELKISVTEDMLAEQNFVQFAAGLDLLVVLTDNQLSRCVLSTLALKQRLNVIECSVSGFEGLLGAFCYADPDFVKKFGCYGCLAGSAAELEAQAKMEPARALGITGPAAAQMAAAAAGLVLSVLTGRMDKSFYGTLRHFDLKSQRVQSFKLHPRENCPECAAARAGS